MAGRKAETYWAKGNYQAQGYRNEPGSDDIPKGRTGEALLRADRAEVGITVGQEVPEVYSTPSTHVGHHDGHPRTVAADYYPESHILRIHFPGGAAYNYYSVSPDEWEDFQSVSSPGRWLNDNPHSYGQA